MLFAIEITTESVQAVQAVLLAGIAAWVTVATRRIDAAAKEAGNLATHASAAVVSLADRVRVIEATQPSGTPPNPAK